MSYAGFWKRVAAVIIDAIIIMIGVFAIVSVFDMIMVISGVDDRAFMGTGGEIRRIILGFDDRPLPEGAIETILRWVDDRAGLEEMANILGIILGWVYFASMESSPTQGTLGKMALGIKVTDIEGNKIGFEKALNRCVGKIISTIILLIGFIMIAFTQKKQGLHDMMVGSLVVNK